MTKKTIDEHFFDWYQLWNELQRSRKYGAIATNGECNADIIGDECCADIYVDNSENIVYKHNEKICNVVNLGDRFIKSFELKIGGHVVDKF